MKTTSKIKLKIKLWMKYKLLLSIKFKIWPFKNIYQYFSKDSLYNKWKKTDKIAKKMIKEGYSVKDVFLNIK